MVVCGHNEGVKVAEAWRSGLGARRHHLAATPNRCGCAVWAGTALRQSKFNHRRPFGHSAARKGQGRFAQLVYTRVHPSSSELFRLKGMIGLVDLRVFGLVAKGPLSPSKSESIRAVPAKRDGWIGGFVGFWSGRQRRAASEQFLVDPSRSELFRLKGVVGLVDWWIFGLVARGGPSSSKSNRVQPGPTMSKSVKPEVGKGNRGWKMENGKAETPGMNSAHSGIKAVKPKSRSVKPSQAKSNQFAGSRVAGRGGSGPEPNQSVGRCGGEHWTSQVPWI